MTQAHSDSLTIGERIRDLRVSAGMHQVELAEKIGRHPAALRNNENGRRNPDPITISRLAMVFGTTAEYIRTGRETEPAAGKAA